jgi:hypothetical protein
MFQKMLFILHNFWSLVSRFLAFSFWETEKYKSSNWSIILALTTIKTKQNKMVDQAKYSAGG